MRPPREDGAPSRTSRFAPACLSALVILRPHNCLIAFFSVLLGGWLGIHAVPHHLLLAALSAALIMGGSNTFNDTRDIAADRINRPSRPLPAQRLPVWAALTEAVVLSLAGIWVAGTLPRPVPELALAATAGLFFYNIRLKRVPLAGNLMVGLLGGLAFLYGGFAVGVALPALVPALFACLFHLGREILKDVEDLEGDRLLPGSTVPIRWGPRKACALITAIYLVLIVATPLPALLGPYGLRYLALVLALDALLIHVILSLWRSQTPGALRRLNGLLKIGMLLGISAFFIDGL